jgi:hypothetical protein
VITLAAGPVSLVSLVDQEIVLKTSVVRAIASAPPDDRLYFNFPPSAWP